jgi:putative MFS transporter
MKFYLKISTLAGMGAFLDGYDFIVFVAALSLITISLGTITTADKGLLLGMAFLGAFFGSILLGHYTDKIGRKRIFLITIALFALAALFMGFAVNYVWLFIGRFIIGFSLGADYAVSWTMVSEFSPRRLRAGLISYLQLIYSIGALISYLIVVALLSAGDLDWRIAIWIGIVPALVTLFLRRSIPESPRWLAAQGRTKEAKDIITSTSTEISNDNLEILKQVNKKSFSILFSHKYVRRMSGTIIIQMLAFFLFIPVTIYTPTVLALLGFSKSLEYILLGSTIEWIFIIFGFLAGVFLIDKMKRKIAASLSFIIIGIMLIVLMVLRPTGLSILLPWGVMAFFLSFGSAVIWTWSSELFPTTARGLAQGLNTAANRIIGFGGSTVDAVLLARGISAFYVILLTVCVILILAILFWINVETKGVSLEQISEGVPTGGKE